MVDANQKIIKIIFEEIIFLLLEIVRINQVKKRINSRVNNPPLLTEAVWVPVDQEER